MDARLATPQARVAEALWRDVAQPGAPAGEFVTEVEPTAGRIASSGPGREEGQAVASRRIPPPPPPPGLASGRAAAQPRPGGGPLGPALPAAPRTPAAAPGPPRARSHLSGPRQGRRCRARRVLARLRRLRRELRAEPSLLPVLPPPAPLAPRGSAGCLRGPLRWEKEEAPRAPGAGSRANNSSERWAPFGGQHPCPTSRVSGNALPPWSPRPSAPSSAPSISPPRSSGSGSPLRRPLSLLPSSARSGPGCPRLTVPFLPAQLAAPQARARLTGASTSSMEQPSLRSLKVSTGVLRWGTSPRPPPWPAASGETWLAGGRAAEAEDGSCPGAWGLWGIEDGMWAQGRRGDGLARVAADGLHVLGLV